ncbi:MAG: hypothetical protein EBT61_20415 [Verrucomicrobia bacterium]|nr:hypothetical protein [Verrucomicrobiota bacterium]
MELIHDTGNPAAARRVWDLQQEGHRIEKVDEGGGVFRWIYRGAPLPQGPKLTQRSLLDLITRDMVAVGKDEKPRHIRGVRGFVSQF